MVLRGPPIDPHRFREIYDRYGGLVFRRARRLLADEAAARDACHDVFLQVLAAGASWAPPSPVAWLYTVTTNRCLNLLREKRRRQRDAALVKVAPEQRSSETPVTLLLRGVPEHLQEIAIYYGVDEMTQDEIAVALGISQKTVSNRIGELRQALRPDDSPIAPTTDLPEERRGRKVP